MSKQFELLAAVYADEGRAKDILDMLQEMHRATTITIDDSAMVTKGADGKLQIHETREVTTKKGLKRGAIAAGVFGLLFPPSIIASAVAGGAIGAAWGKLRDTGIKSGSIKELGDALEPGKAAVIVLVDEQTAQAAENALKGWDGEVVRHAFTTEESVAIETSAAEEPVAQ